MITLNTQIKDIDTLEPIGLATVVITDANGVALPINGQSVVGRTADIDGNFILPVILEDAFIKVSSVGYQTIVHPAIDYVDDVIYLKSSLNELKGVVITGKKAVVKHVKKYTGFYVAGAIIFLSATSYYLYKKFKQ